MAKFLNKKSCYIAPSVKLAGDVVIYPNVVIEGVTYIGEGTIIYNGCYINDAIIGKNNKVYSSHINNSVIGNNNLIGPYANFRSGCVIEDNIKVGAFVELKEALIHSNSEVPHLTYLGDASIGENVNIGCGVVTANYDGENKYKTEIGNNAFIGCNVNLIAPIKVGDDTFIAAGSTVGRDVSDGEFVIERGEERRKQNKRVFKKRK